MNSLNEIFLICNEKIVYKDTEGTISSDSNISFCPVHGRILNKRID